MNDARFSSVLHKRDVRHGLAPGDEAGESDEEPERKKARIIEEPEGGDVPSLGSDQDMLFGPSDFDGTEAGGRVDEPPSRDSRAATERLTDEPTDKRQRISGIDAVVDKVIAEVRSLAEKHVLGDVATLSSRDEARRIFESLDKSYTNKLKRRASKVVYATGWRSRRRADKSSRGVGEAFCPPRLTEVAGEYGLDA